MKTYIMAATALAFSVFITDPTFAGPRNLLDRVEDRIDRRENILDERVDHGRYDVIEDRVDRLESRRDRAGKRSPRAVSAWEHRSWRKHRRTN